MNPTTVIAPKSEELTAARALMPMPQGRSFVKETVAANGYTVDIIKAITTLFHASYRDTEKLAPQLRGRTPADTFARVWNFARHQITYVLDHPPGYQYIKTPRTIIQTGFCDCKGLSILQNSLLVNLGYKPAFKFVSYVAGGEATHVYTEVTVDGQTYVLDACMYAFNTEKPYSRAQLVPAL